MKLRLSVGFVALVFSVATFGQTEQAGFPIEFDESIHVPAPVDVDDDGTLEVVVHAIDGLSGERGMFAFHNDGASVTDWPAIDDSYTRRPPLAAYLSDGGDISILYPRPGPEFAALSGGGDEVDGWPVSVEGSYGVPHSYCLADVDGDGDFELVVSGSPDATITVVDGDGSVLEGWPVDVDAIVRDLDGTLDWETVTIASVSSGDVDFDGDWEIFVGLVYVYDGNHASGPALLLEGDGATADGWPRMSPSFGRSTFAYATLIDINRDGECEFFANNLADEILSITAAGEEFIPPIEVEGLSMEPIFGDFDGDDQPELLAVGTNLMLFDIFYDEASLGWASELLCETDGTYTTFKTAAVADLDGDGKAEVLAHSARKDGESQTTFHVLDSTLGNLNEDWPHEVDGGYETVVGYGVALEDIDGDNDIEAIYQHRETLYVWDLDNPSSRPVRVDWGTRHHNLTQSGFYHTGNYPKAFVRGDANGDGALGLTDAPFMVQVLFEGVDADSCWARFDFDANGNFGVLDVMLHLMYVFLDGQPPPFPFPACDRAAQVLPGGLGCADSECAA